MSKKGYLILGAAALAGCLTGQPTVGQTNPQPVTPQEIKVEYVQGDATHPSFHKFSVAKNDAKRTVDGNFVGFNVEVEYAGEAPQKIEGSSYHLGSRDATLNVYNLDTSKVHAGGKVRVNLFRTVDDMNGPHWQEAVTVEDADVRDFPGAVREFCYITNQTAPQKPTPQSNSVDPNAAGLVAGAAGANANNADAQAEAAKRAQEAAENAERTKKVKDLVDKVANSFVAQETNPTAPYQTDAEKQIDFKYLQKQDLHDDTDHSLDQNDDLLFDAEAGAFAFDLLEVKLDGTKEKIGTYSLNEKGGPVLVRLPADRDSPNGLEVRYIRKQGSAPNGQQSGQPTVPPIDTKYALRGRHTIRLVTNAGTQGYKSVELFSGDEKLSEEVDIGLDETDIAVLADVNRKTLRFVYVKDDSSTEKLEGAEVSNVKIKSLASLSKLDRRLDKHAEEMRRIRADARRDADVTMQDGAEEMIENMDNHLNEKAAAAESPEGKVQKDFDEFNKKLKEALGQDKTTQKQGGQ